MIWTEAFLGPQLVEVFVQDYFHGRHPWPDPHQANKLKYHPGLHVTYPVFRTHGERLPHLFCINTETRELASKSYEICLSTSIDPRIRFHPRRPKWILSDSAYQSQINLYQKLDRLKSRIIPTSINKILIRRKHAKFIAKGIYFQPKKDRIYFRHTPGDVVLSDCMHNLHPSALKTENITSLAMDWKLCRHDNEVCRHFCVPHIFPHFIHWKRAEQMMAHLEEFVIVADMDVPFYQNGFGGIRWPMVDVTPRVVETYGASGRLNIVIIFESELPGWKAGA